MPLSHLTIRELSDVADLGQLESLWLALHRHHRAVSEFNGLVDDDGASWSRRHARYERWMRSGQAIVLVADVALPHPAAYLVARLCEGPDDTFAVASEYAEVYSLSVAEAHRGEGIGTALMDELDRRLAARGIVDLTESVMACNDEALRFYNARGLVRAEVTLWRLGARP